MLTRIKFEIEPVVNMILDQQPVEVWKSESTSFYDPTIGGGQYVREIEARLRKAGHSDANINKRVFGSELNDVSINYAVNKYNLVGQYNSRKQNDKYPTNWGKDMKFDVVMSNPPYNKNLITKDYSVYNHPAMNSEKEGYIGIFIDSLALLSSNGRLVFITPSKYMIGSGTKKFRKWISDNYNLVDIKFLDTAIFVNVSLDKVVVTTIINNAYQNSTAITDVNGNTISMDFTKTKSLIIPNFGDQALFDRYIKVKSFVPVDTCKSVGKYGDSSKDNYSKVKLNTHQYEVITEIVDGSPVIEYTNLQSGHESVKKWRVITNMAFPQGFAIIPPGAELSHTKFGIAFDTESNAMNFLNWTKTTTWSKLWNGLSGTRHTHVVIRNMPLNPI